MEAVPQLQEPRSASHLVCLPHFMLMSCMVPLTLQQCKSIQGQVQSFLSGVTDLGTMSQVGRHYGTGYQCSVICTCVSVVHLIRRSRRTNSQPGLWQYWVYQHIWAQIGTLLSSSNISPSCYEQQISDNNVTRLCCCRLVMWGPQCRTAWILASLAALQPSTC